MNILLVCPMKDEQSGMFLQNSLIQLKHRVAYFDWRHIVEEKGVKNMNKILIDSVEQLKPELILIIKGVGITGETIKRLKEKHKTNIVGWIFDVTLGGTFIKDVPQYINMIKELDTFYTIDADAINELKKLKVNAKWLTQGCFPKIHKEPVYNSIQQRKWGTDIVFLGSVGSIHLERDKFLKRLHDEGYPYKIYGNVYYPKNQEPTWVKDHHTGYEAINEHHSLICATSKIIIGLDGWTDRKYSWSFRLYKTLCANGFYLTKYTKGMEDIFKIGEHLDTFKTEEEMVKKIDYYLTHDE